MGQVIKIVVWEEDGSWLGYLQDYPDYLTQGETREELNEHLKEIYLDISSGEMEFPSRARSAAE